MSSRRSFRTTVRATATAGAVLLVSAACAEQGDTTGGSSPEIADGASLDAYQEAFADVEPIEMVAQTAGPRGQPSSQKFEDYLAAVTEWSDGKITFDVHFANAIAPPHETDNALADGRVDIGFTLPNSEPSEFPASAALNGVSFLGSQTPVLAMLESHGWSLEIANNTPELIDAFEAADNHVLVPWFGGGKVGLFCSDPARTFESFAGRQTATGSQVQAAEAEALGMVPTSLPYVEVYESLQRGVTDCSLSSFTVAVLGGFIPQAPHVTVDPDAGWGLSGGTLAVGKARWDSLPLIAQQLLHDRLDVFLERNIEVAMDGDAEALREIAAAGGEVGELDAEGRQAVQAANDTALEGLRSTDAVADGAAWADDIVAASERWTGIVADLGYEEPVGFNEFGEWYEDGKVDLEPYIDRLMAEAFDHRRPGGTS